MKKKLDPFKVEEIIKYDNYEIRKAIEKRKLFFSRLLCVTNTKKWDKL